MELFEKIKRYNVMKTPFVAMYVPGTYSRINIAEMSIE